MGLDYNSSRLDFEYGSPFGSNKSFHVGGFFRQGEGPRTAGYTANNGGQLKFNVTKRFEGGFGRVYYKFLNDRAIAYMPMPLKVEGTNDSPTWGSIDGYDATTGTMHSSYLLQNLGIGVDGQLRRSDVADGMHPVSQSIGAEFVRNLDNGWSVKNRVRLAFNSGRFVSPFPAGLHDESTFAGNEIWNKISGTVDADYIADNGLDPDDLSDADKEAILANNASIRSVQFDPYFTYLLEYANGSDAGNAFNNTNNLIMRIHMFDTELNNFNNFVNDFKVSKQLGSANVTVGYYRSLQSISMSWLWNTYLMEVNGEDAALIDFYSPTVSYDNATNAIALSADSAKYTQNGLYAYGVPAWGNCCQRSYDADYEISAPYFSAEMDLGDAIKLDASIRMDEGHVTGHFAGTVQTEYDVNNDGVISPYEESVSAIDNANTTPVDYTYDYISYSFGVNYKLSESQAVFGRYSAGGSAKADRLLFARSQYLDETTMFAKDMVYQAELGYKHLFNKGGVFATFFMANTVEEGGYEATTQKTIENDYEAFGLELEGAYDLGMVDLRGGMTYTSAEITSGDNKGNVPRRQPVIMFNLVPTFAFGAHSTGLSIIGQTDAYAQDSNELVLPGYMIVNAFLRYQLTDKLEASVNANNLTNALGITESEEGAITDNEVNYVRARPITGRTVSLSLGYQF